MPGGEKAASGNRCKFRVDPAGGEPFFWHFVHRRTRFFRVNRTPERWQSGRMRALGKRVFPQGNRGFESLPLRHSSLECECFKIVVGDLDP